MEFDNYKSTTKIVAERMFQLNSKQTGQFFKKTLSNMKNFWLKLERDKILEEI